MKFAICLLVSYVCLISGYPINEEHSFGTVSRGEIMGTKEVKAEMPMTHRMEYTKYEFTFPEVSLPMNLVIFCKFFNLSSNL